MDVDMMKSSSAGGEEQTDMMTMMIQIEKLPDFCEPFHDATSSSALKEMQFSNGSHTSIYHDPQQSSLGSINATPDMPFMGTPIQGPNFVPNKFKYEPPNFSTSNSFLSLAEKKNSTAAIREMIFRIAVMQPIHIDPESIKAPKRRNVRISKDPQSVAARHRRERISERIRILQRLVPGGTKMDTASMLDEAVHYLKFLKKQVQTLEQAGTNRPMTGFGFLGMTTPKVGHSSLFKNCAQPAANMLGSLQMMLR